LTLSLAVTIEVLGTGAVEGLDGDAEDQPRVATMQQPQGVRGALGNLLHQLFIAGGVVPR